MSTTAKTKVTAEQVENAALRNIIEDALHALDKLDAAVAVETWDDDRVPPAVRGNLLAVRYHLATRYHRLVHGVSER